MLMSNEDFFFQPFFPLAHLLTHRETTRSLLPPPTLSAPPLERRAAHAFFFAVPFFSASPSQSAVFRLCERRKEENRQPTREVGGIMGGRHAATT